MRKADNLPLSCADVKKSGVLTSWNPVGLFRAVMGQHCLFLFYISEPTVRDVSMAL